MQNSQAACGSTSLHNALAAVGITRTPDECEALCGTTATDGTSVRKMIRAARMLTDAHPLRERRPDVALLVLLAALRTGHPVLCVVDDGEHWCAAVGVLGDRVLVADPADNELVLSVTQPEFARRWAEEGAARPYQGVIL